MLHFSNEVISNFITILLSPSYQVKLPFGLHLTHPVLCNALLQHPILTGITLREVLRLFSGTLNGEYIHATLIVF